MEKIGNNFEGKELKGRNVDLKLKIIRHGERDLQGRLTDYGREKTAEAAENSDLMNESFDAVKAVGSDAGRKQGFGMRALETADIYAKTIAGDEAFESRVRNILSYETLKNPAPYKHVEIYNANLPANYNELPDKEKALAAKKAQGAVIDHLVGLHSPEAEAYKKEMAGAYAYLIEHYSKLIQRLDSDSRILMPAGTHGGMMEFLLQQALVREGEDGSKILGFQSTEEIGGEFSPSESYDIDIATDELGNAKPLAVTLPNRNVLGKLYLDKDIVRELAQYYSSLHEEK